MKRLYETAAYDTSRKIGSHWEAFADPALRLDAAEGEIDADIAIIGGGFTGLNAALQLAEEHGMKAVILEAGQIGWGASGRNGGFNCLGGTKLSHARQIARFGLEETRAHVAFQRAAVERVADNLTRYRIDADTHSDGELILAHRPDLFPKLRAEAEAAKATFGLGFQAYDRTELAEIGATGPDFFGGIRETDGFALNPMKYVQGLARAALAAGVDIFGDSPVTGISSEAGRHVLTTPKARIRARKLIVATNGYSSDDIPDAMSGRTMPVLSAVLVTRPISKDEQLAQGWTSDLMAYDARHLLHYFRLMPDGRFLFGQRGATRWTDAAIAKAKARNRQDFERMFPAWRDVETEHFWGGFVCMTRQLHPFIGPLPGLQNAFAAFGYHGNGVSMASASGRAIGDIASGKPTRLPALLAADSGRFPFAGLRRLYLRAAYVKYQVEDRFF